MNSEDSRVDVGSPIPCPRAVQGGHLLIVRVLNGLLVVKKVDLCRFCVFWQPPLFHSIRVRCSVSVLILS